MSEPRPPLANQQKPARWKRWLSILLAPCLAVILATLGWWWMPKPALPSAIETINDVMPNNTTKPPVMPTTKPAASTSTAAKTQDSHSAKAPAPQQANAPLDTSGKKTIVALGDSITFGYNLPGATATKPSPHAYPFLVAKQEKWTAVDLGVTGWESSNLLAALHTKKYQDALKKANVVTLDIGSNDLLHTTYDLLAEVQQPRPAKENVLQDSQYRTALLQYQKNLPQIVGGIRKTTKAPIVLMNLYDPFPDGSSLHDIGEQLIAAANQVIYQTAATYELPVVDVYDVMNHHQELYVRLNALDIHPTVSGQQAIASAVEATLHKPLWYQPAAYAMAKKGTTVSSQTSPGPYAIAWLPAGHGLPVTGQTGSWWRVLTAQGDTGYVPASRVQVVLRPRNDVTFSEQKVSVRTGKWTDDTSARSAQALEWNGVLYAPVSFLAAVADAHSQYDSAQHQVGVTTLGHSGLVHSGLLNPVLDNSPISTPQPHVTVNLTSTHTKTIRTDGLLVSVDGEPLFLTHAPILVDGEVYVPAEAFWSSLGGAVTRGTSGLPTLSASGS